MNWFETSSSSVVSVGWVGEICTISPPIICRHRSTGIYGLRPTDKKTGTETNIRLLDTAKHIIEKYKGMAEGNRLLPVPCYANCRHGIKTVAKLCGIQKNVCWHQSRHSYATTICLSNGVPIETLSKLMGHTSIRSTQIYAKITAEKVSNDIENLSKQIEPMESFICQSI